MTDKQLADRVNNERIVEAAICYRDGIKRGRTHAGIILVYGYRGTQGFMTSAGRFVDRHEAARIAIAAGQVSVPEMVEARGCLYSYDLI